MQEFDRSEEHTSELQSHHDLVCRLLLEKKKHGGAEDASVQTRLIPIPVLHGEGSGARAASGDPEVFFFNDTATPEIYTLSLHDALPICRGRFFLGVVTYFGTGKKKFTPTTQRPQRDRKSTRLNSSHITISYAVFGL